LLDGVRLNENDLNSTKLFGDPRNRSNASRFCPAASAVLFAAADRWQHQHHHKAPTPTDFRSVSQAMVPTPAPTCERARTTPERLAFAECATREDNTDMNNRLRQDSLVATTLQGWETNAGLKFGRSPELQLPGCAQRDRICERSAGAQRRELFAAARRIWHAILGRPPAARFLQPTWGIATTIRRPTSRRP